MNNAANDPEMRRRFEAAERVAVGETALRSPVLRPTPASLREHFASVVGRAQVELQNPHLEARVTAEQRDAAIPAGILLGIVLREPEPTILVTQRHEDISNPGHWVFPGGRADDTDASPVETALREANEEIGLALDRVEVLGRLGDYVSHSGFRIMPTLALVHPPFELTPRLGEVEAIVEIELSRLLDSSNYFLYRFQDRQDRAHFAMDASHAGVMLTGATVSICIGLYSELLKSHAAAR